MDSILSFVFGLLTTTLSFFGFVQQPELFPPTRDQAQLVSEQATTQATQTLPTEDASILFSVSPTSGPAPLTVHFVSNKYATQDAGEPQHYVDFGDGTERGRITCAKSSGADVGSYRCLEWGVDHHYSSSGVYSAKLIQKAPCLSGSCSAPRPEKVLKTTIVTVSQGSGTASSASNVQTYTNSPYGFSFQYPQDMTVKTSAYDSVPAVSSEAPVAYIRIDDGLQTEGYITFNVTSVTHCEAGASSANTSINGTPFRRSDTGQADASGFERRYVASKKMCYIIQLISFPSACVNSGCMNRQWSATTMQNILNKLDTIAQTFRFTQ